ncbi:MAG TPA: TolC family protein [Thermoanaerobaculia bacterium]|nr:TolC family protein [Thermoanaerobaculia bacterium]
MLALVALALPSFANEPWWTRFEDPALTHLVNAALRGNHDLREAVQRVEASRAMRGEARQAYLPTGGPIAERHRNVTTHGIDIGWEIDLFGRVRSLNRAAEADLGMHEALLAQARIVVAADVARTYFLLRGAEARVQLLERYRADQAEVVKLIETRVEEGVDDEADLARARTVLAEDLLALTSERHNVRVLRNALAVLIGAEPGQWDVPAGAASAIALDAATLDMRALLQQRPDVRAAERALAAQTAEIGIATSALFPRLSLGGFTTIGPTLSWGIFDLGRVRAQIRREKAQAEGALVAYERTVLRALEDADNAFSAFASAQESLGASDLQLRNARIAADLVALRYEEGVSGYFELLDARRSALRAEIARIGILSAQQTATVDVFRALGIAVQ